MAYSARVGGDRVIHTDVRVSAATNRDLEAGIRAGQFREDLYYRLNVIEVRVPPLRERREEIPALVGHLMTRFKKEYGSTPDLPATTLRAFTEYSWPGNVRELENTLKRIVVRGNAEHVPRIHSGPCRGPIHDARDRGVPRFIRGATSAAGCGRPFRGPIHDARDRGAPRFIRGATSAAGCGRPFRGPIHDARDRGAPRF